MDIVPGYERLAIVLQAALDQAQHGKGKDRHANDKPFLDQPMLEIGRMVGPAGTIFQAMKKAQECLGLPEERAIRECYGAINYLAGTVLLLQERIDKKADLIVLQEGTDGEPERCCRLGGPAGAGACGAAGAVRRAV